VVRVSSLGDVRLVRGLGGEGVELRDSGLVLRVSGLGFRV
jgi:hypothetical protein